MADQELVRDIREGRGINTLLALGAISRPIDLRDADLWNVDLRGANLEGANLEAANLENADLTGANLTRATLARASANGLNLTNAVCDHANFSQTDLHNVKFDGASFRGATLTAASIPRFFFTTAQWSETIFSQVDLSGFDLSGLNFSKCNFQHANLRGTKLRSAKLDQATLSPCNLEESDLTSADCTLTNFSGATLKEACLKNVNLDHAILDNADMSGADIEGSDFREARLDGARMSELRNVPRSKNLLTTVINRHELYFDTAKVSWFDRWLDWEKVRIAGRLPLFGASYSALISIPLFFYLLELYNDKVHLLRSWAEQELATDAIANKSWADTLLQHLHPLPVPELSILLLLATLLLAIGSTIYALACPSRIKEFSRDQWTYQLGRSVVHYLPAAWSKPWLRGAALILYVLGGAGAGIVLLSKLWNVFWFIVGSR